MGVGGVPVLADLPLFPVILTNPEMPGMPRNLQICWGVPAAKESHTKALRGQRRRVSAPDFGPARIARHQPAWLTLADTRSFVPRSLAVLPRPCAPKTPNLQPRHGLHRAAVILTMCQPTSNSPRRPWGVHVTAVSLARLTRRRPSGSDSIPSDALSPTAAPLRGLLGPAATKHTPYYQYGT